VPAQRAELVDREGMDVHLAKGRERGLGVIKRCKQRGPVEGFGHEQGYSFGSTSLSQVVVHQRDSAVWLALCGQLSDHRARCRGDGFFALSVHFRRHNL